MQGKNSQIQMPQWQSLANSNPDISRREKNKEIWKYMKCPFLYNTIKQIDFDCDIEQSQLGKQILENPHQIRSDDDVYLHLISQ